MTPSALIERGRSLVARWWALPLLLVVVALGIGWKLEAGRRGEAAARRLAEEQLARTHDLLVVEQAKAKDVRADADRLAAEVPELKAELERAKKAIPGARVVAASSSSTGPVPAGGAPRPNWPCSPAHPCAAPAAGEPEPRVPECILAAGDEGEIRVDQVVLDGPGGARMVVGAASAYRLTPEPRARLFGGPFRAALSEASSVAPPATPGWGGGGYLGFTRGGWAAGPSLAPPPVHVLGHQLEVILGAGVGSSGVWSGSGTAVVRW